MDDPVDTIARLIRGASKELVELPARRRIPRVRFSMLEVPGERARERDHHNS